MSGFVTAGEDLVLELTLELDGTAVSIETYTNFETRVRTKDGKMVIANADHDVIEATGSNLGRVNVEIAAAESAYLAPGKNIAFCVIATDSLGVVHTFWGKLPQVRSVL